MALYSYATLFSLATEEDSRYNMPPGAAGLAQRWSMGLPVGPDSAAVAVHPGRDSAEVETNQVEHGPVEHGPVEHGPVERGSSKPIDARAVGWSLAGAGLVLVCQLFARRLRGREPPPDSADLPLSVLEALARESVMTGAQADFITRRFQQLKPSALEQVRNDALLLAIHGRGGSVPVAPGYPPDSFAIESALRAGLIEQANGSLEMTPAGQSRVQVLVADQPAREWVQFVERRLDETLTVGCPHCGASQQGHWLRPTLACTSCHRRFKLRDSSSVVPCAP